MKRFHIDSTVRVKLTREGEHYFKEVWAGRDMMFTEPLGDIPTVMQTAMQVAKIQNRRFAEPVNGMIDLTLREFLMVFGGQITPHTFMGESDLSRTIEEWFILDPHDLVDVDSLGHQDMVQLELPPSEVSDIVGYLYQLEDDTGSDTEYLRGLFEDALEEHANLN